MKMKGMNDRRVRVKLSLSESKMWKEEETEPSRLFFYISSILSFSSYCFQKDLIVTVINLWQMKVSFLPFFFFFISFHSSLPFILLGVRSGLILLRNCLDVKGRKNFYVTNKIQVWLVGLFPSPSQSRMMKSQGQKNEGKSSGHLSSW